MATVAIDPPRINEVQVVRADFLRKLLSRALHPSATEAEAENAAIKFIRASRRAELGLADLAEVFGPRPIKPPPAFFIVMSQGRYAGCALGEIGMDDLQYLRWMSQEFRDADLREAASIVLSFFMGGDRDE